MTDPAPDADPDLAADALPSPRAASFIPPPSPARPPRSRLRGVGVALWLILLALLGVAGWAGYEWWQQHESLSQQVERTEANARGMSSRITALETQGGEIATRQADLSRSANRNATDIAALQSSISESQRLMGRISDELSGGRTRFQLAAIESLLIMAIDRLQLEHDAATALTALETADERLAAINDPRLFPVREAIAEERSALRAVPRADVASAALSLGSLIDRVPQLPLIAHAPSQFVSPDVRGESPPAEADMPGWKRLLASVTTAAKSLFTIRRDDNSRSTRLLPPEQEAIVYQVLTLELEGARVALLRGNTAAFRDCLRSAASWLDLLFKPVDPWVLAVRGDFVRLRGIELSPPLPDIGRSLEKLRNLLESTKP
jgi:uncharacterized protein HemX